MQRQWPRIEATVKGPYNQRSVRDRIEAFFLDPSDPSKWQPLCGRHQVMKKNYWDDETGWLNVVAIVQAASEVQKREVFDFLKRYFREGNS